MGLLERELNRELKTNIDALLAKHPGNTLILSDVKKVASQTMDRFGYMLHGPIRRYQPWAPFFDITDGVHIRFYQSMSLYVEITIDPWVIHWLNAVEAMITHYTKKKEHNDE
jgi:hypothetical protein